MAVVSFDLVWAAGSGQDMPCGSAGGGRETLGSRPALFSTQALLMEWGWLPIWHLYEGLGALEIGTLSHQAVSR